MPAAKPHRAQRPPRPRDAEATRAALLARAHREFADRGFDGARIDEIAASAGINKRMIYAYFGDKEGLYLAALDGCLGQALEMAHEGEIPAGATPLDRARVIIRRFYDYLADHPDFVRLLTWEVLSTERRGRKILLDRLEAGIEPLRAIVRHGIADGTFRADLEPRFVLLSVNALLLGYFGQRPFLETLWKTDLSTPEARELVISQLLRVLLEGIRARP